MKLCDAVAQISFLFTKIQVERNCVKHTPHTNLVIESVSFFFMLGTNAALNRHAIVKQANKFFKTGIK